MGKAQGETMDIRIAARIAYSMQERLEEHRGVKRALVAGSIRRRLAQPSYAGLTVRDADLLVVKTKAYDTKALDQILDDGWMRLRVTEKQAQGKVAGVQVELWSCTISQVGPMLVFLTGPADFNVWMRTRAKMKGLKLSQYGVFRKEQRVDEPSCVPNLAERHVFQAVGVPYLTPAEREHWELRREELEELTTSHR